MKQILRQNFIYPKITDKTRIFGDVGTILRPDGDWRKFLPKEEEQRRRGIESSSCYIQASHHAIATILEEQFGVIDSDFSERFNALLSDGTENGGDPIAGADSIRHDGLVADALLPFSENITSWDEFHSWEGGDKDICIKEGKEWLKQWKPNYNIVFEREHSLEMKYNRLREQLKKSPVPMSVYGVTDGSGNYVPKPEGINDTHLLTCVYLDEDNCPWVFDTYPSFLKKLPANYSSDFAMSWGIKKNTNPIVKIGCFETFTNSLFRKPIHV